MPAPHYALSEALIVFAALWVAWKMARGGGWLGALGVATFGFAAGIGVIRFGFGRIEELADFHQAFAQIGGATAMALVALQCCMGAMRIWSGWRLGLATIFAVATLALGLLEPSASVPAFLAWLIVGAIGCAALPAPGMRLRLARAAVFASFLVNVLLIRRSPLLSMDASWHIYHALIALWLIGVWWVLVKGSYRTQPAPHNL